ncbi:MAG: ADP-glyceromanno-heptose 6-epimerase [Bacteroidota bacterium]|nr:ADP-glyceromanno-heptose 6-epimerase [Bacteroidota bacterium]MDX5429158.1 ADP-glyceromanno-heptose 6-epimerase [Bacteroidota bacterium]MDX5448476.1 ADP-glyceromanno-heptose 6-epimerase [Bacteroidota bacterium]MDX5506796.1 ADP-glyceromanno-heptose 6-epimerase [Bacteroidota bacterium]
MIIVTGAAGFIGSCLVGKLNRQGHENIILVDDFSREDKRPNWESKKYVDRIERNKFLPWLKENLTRVEFVYHLGARTDTTEFDKAVFDELNVHFSQEVFKACAEGGIPLIYASSAATYGLGEFGYKDDNDLAYKLKPLNPYGESKNDFDKWALQQKVTPPIWKGIKFFNVFGPNEFHKGRMASVVFHTFNQVRDTGKMKLFRSHDPAYKDGQQLRDFIYVKDAEDVLYFLLKAKGENGLYNLGTGQARTFLDLARSTFVSMGLAPEISFIDTPEDIRDKYQYFTEADMTKMRMIGYDKDFSPLEFAIEDYVKNHLIPGRYY